MAYHLLDTFVHLEDISNSDNGNRFQTSEDVLCEFPLARTFVLIDRVTRENSQYRSETAQEANRQFEFMGPQWSAIQKKFIDE